MIMWVMVICFICIECLQSMLLYYMCQEYAEFDTITLGGNNPALVV